MSDKVCAPPDTAPSSEVRAKLLQDPSNSLDNLAKQTGMSDKCVQVAKTQSGQVMNDAKVLAVGLWGGAAGATTTTTNNLDNSMMQSGCGAFALTANTLLSSTANMSCNFNSTTSGQTTTTNSNNSVTFETVAPSAAVVASINATVASNFAAIATLANSINTVNQRNNESDAAFNARLKAIADNVAVLKQLAQDYQDNNPTAGDIKNSNLTFTIKAGVTVKSAQSMNSTASSSILEHARAVAGAVAFNKLSQATGVNSLTPESKSMVQNKINTEISNQAVNINHLITKNTATVNQSGVIHIKIAGSVIGSTINTNLSSQMEVAVSQVVKAAVHIGNTVGAAIIGDIHTTDDSTQVSKGLSDLIDSANKGLTDEITQADKGQNAFFSGFESLIGNIFVIAAIVAVAVVFFLPNIVPSLANVFPPPIKYALIAILVYLVVAWFISFPPFSKPPDKRIDERFLQGGVDGMLQGYSMTNPKKPVYSQFQRPYHHEIVLQ